MKKLHYIIICSFLLCCFTACGRASTNPPVSNETHKENVDSSIETNVDNLETTGSQDDESVNLPPSSDRDNTDTEEPTETDAHNGETIAPAPDSPPNDGTVEDFQYCDAIDMRAHYYNFETFLSDDKLAQILFNRETELNGGSGNNSTMNTDSTFSFPYPIVKSPDFEVNSIWIDDDGIHYTVMPYTENGHLYPFYWGKLGFWIDFIPDVSLWDGIEADYEGYNYYIYDDTHAYDESDSEFCIDFPNMGYLRVRFPDAYDSPDDRIVTLEGLYSYFDFEIHTCTYSPTAETGAVQ